MEMEGSIQKNLASKVIIGIDFGTSGIAFAYGFLDDPDKKVYQGHFSGQGQNAKIPSEIILDNELKEVKAFGLDCSSYINQNNSNEYNHFKKIKMHLYNKSYIIKSNNQGKEANIELIIRLMLIEIKKKVIEEIKQSYPQLVENNCRFVITVPAIWDYKSKQVMLESAKNAKLFNEEDEIGTFFALEPEAASMYCAINKDIDRTYFEKGSYYIVCDLGGGTGDIVAHLVGSNNKLNEIFPSCGGAFGSNEIDKSIFKDVIMKLFGCQDFYTFCSKYKKYNKEIFDEGELYSEWSEFERQIKDFKEGATNENIENNDYYSINCSMFQDIYDSNKKIDINDLVKEYNDNVEDRELILNVKKNKRRWIVEFPYKIINHYMKIQANSICKIINEINKNENIKTIIFVGGYSNNKIILKLIENGLKKIKIILYPSNPSLAIMEGAVLFGIEPSAIDVRIAKFTIGERLDDVWNEKKHARKGEKYFNEDEKKWFCKDCFVKYIEINQNLNYGQEIVNSSYICNKDQTYVTFEFYKTKKKNPVFAFEEGLIKMGEFTLDLGEAFEEYEDRKLKTIMKFGGTFIDVTGIHLKTGKTVKAILTFD